MTLCEWGIRTTILMSFVLTSLFSLLTAANMHGKTAYAADVNVSEDQIPKEVQLGLLNYNNLTYAINMLYPSNWSKVESGSDTTDLQKSGLRDYPVTFFATDDLFSKIPTSVMVYIDNLHSSNILLREYYTGIINDIANYEKISVLFN